VLRSCSLYRLLLGLGAILPVQLAAQDPAQESANWQRAFLNQYCIACHNDVTREANFSLQTIALDQVGHRLDEIGIWENVVIKLRAREMPPPGMPRPDAPAYDRLAAWLETSLDDAAAAAPNPGQPVVHRLNRAEYTNAIRDLLALEIDGREYLPADDSGYGFDNIGDVLTLSPSLLERYMIAAAKISQLAVGDPNLLTTVQTYEMRPTLIQEGRMSEEQPFGTRGGNTVSHYFPLDGEYHVKIRLARTHANQIIGLVEPHEIEVRFDRARIAEYTIGGDGVINPWAAVMYASEYEQTADDGLELRLENIEAGAHSITVAFPEKRALPEGILEPALSTASYEFAGDRDMPMALGSIEIYGPYNATKPVNTPSRNKLFRCEPNGSVAGDQACAAEILSTLARRAFRRPVTDDDLTSLMSFYSSGRTEGGFERGIQRALRAILVDPEFLFRIEGTPSDVAPSTAYQISDVELASRLSFFLWSSIPDDQLIDLAEQGTLSDPLVLRNQVARMLADPRSSALIENFTGQWLYLRNLPGLTPDPDAFPEFDDNLREAFRRETEMFVDNQIRNDNNVLELLTADYTFLNERLARHYGINGVYGNHFRKVSFSDNFRGGLLGQGSILAATSYPNRTSPTLRGKWVLDNLLGAPPPAPPPNIPDLEDSDTISPRSVRERLEAHRTNPVCASCHSRMDPFGLALEPFDAIGGLRTHDGGELIDASASLPDGSSFDGPVGVRDYLLGSEERFVATLSKKLLTYALGRGLEDYDPPAVRHIVRTAANDDYSWSSIVLGIVESVPFQMRRSQEP
jgi:hypothetical protein